MFAVDTSVLVYAADEDSPYHGSCLKQRSRWLLFLEPIGPLRSNP